MQLDAYNCHDHWKESCSKTLQAHKDHPELAERVWAHNGVTLAQAQFDAGVPGAKSPVPATGSYIIVESARFNTPFTDQFAQPWEANVSHGDLGIRIKFEVVKISANRFRLCMNSPSFEEPVLKRAVMSTVSNPSDMQLIEEGSLHGACNKGR